MIYKIFFCSELFNIVEKSWRRRRWEKTGKWKAFSFQANAIIPLMKKMQQQRKKELKLGMKDTKVN